MLILSTNDWTKVLLVGTEDKAKGEGDDFVFLQEIKKVFEHGWV